MKLPTFVKLVEVGPRDGLQNEKTNILTSTKINLINQLSDTGLQTIETTSFVSSKWVPQLADAEKVLTGIKKHSNISYPVLVPNIHGLNDAIAAGAKQIAVFTAASETFCHKNTNCSIQESLEHIKDIIKQASKNNLQVRGYISCALGCPYEGNINVNKVAEIATQLYNMGCYEISLGDTVGVGTPLAAQELITTVSRNVPLQYLAAHFHNTYNQALANLFAVLTLGVSIIDCSIGGLGGCPYAKSASGNVATEDVLYMLDGMGIATGVDLTKILQVSNYIKDKLI